MPKKRTKRFLSLHVVPRPRGPFAPPEEKSAAPPEVHTTTADAWTNAKPQVFAGGDILRFVAKVGRVPALKIPQLICVAIRLWQVSPMPANLLAAFDDPQAFPLEPVPFPVRDEPTPEALPLAALLQIERTV